MANSMRGTSVGQGKMESGATIPVGMSTRAAMSVTAMLQQPTEQGPFSPLPLVCVFHFLSAKSDRSPPSQAFVDRPFVGLYAVS